MTQWPMTTSTESSPSIQRSRPRPEAGLLVIDFVNGFHRSRDSRRRQHPAGRAGDDARCSISAAGGSLPVDLHPHRLCRGWRRMRASGARRCRGCASLAETAPASEVVDALAAETGRGSVRARLRRRPSSVHISTRVLIAKGVDTLIVMAGCTTSGCVRASVIDAMSYELPHRGRDRLRRRPGAGAARCKHFRHGPAGDRLPAPAIGETLAARAMA